MKAHEQQVKQQKEENEAKVVTEANIAEKNDKASASQSADTTPQQTPEKDNGKDKDRFVAPNAS